MGSGSQPDIAHTELLGLQEGCTNLRLLQGPLPLGVTAKPPCVLPPITLLAVPSGPWVPAAVAQVHRAPSLSIWNNLCPSS